ncbi:TadE/TadG family type IV pilus assembly protein [Aeoliella mucimassa]|uniref:TadE-like protein n=1 Tax=Aeoliella mucimassa TaxID=2527972 RepID=A0A518ATS6_9BACT|nr:TadE/TadG family type IV pilus assembly protein [Aeoliella mucimassa]QDU58130.1 TadE-like protein [Aeoliella mucimassa]
MNSSLLHRVALRDRRGTTIVETAFVLPIFLMFILSLVEFGHALMVNNVLRSATRAGARLGATEGQTTAKITQHVRQVIGGAIDAQVADISVNSAGVFDEGGSVPETSSEFDALPNIEVADAEPRELFVVRARVDYNDIALVPMPFMSGVVLEGRAFIRHE